MNEEVLYQAARIIELDGLVAGAYKHHFANTFDPRGPYATRIIANALETLILADNSPSDVYFSENPSASLEATNEPTAYVNYEGPVLLVDNPSTSHLLAFAAAPGARGLVVGVLPKTLQVPAEHVGKIRNLEELQRHFDHPGFAGAPIPASHSADEEEIAQAAAIAYQLLLETTPEDVKKALEDFSGHVEDEIYQITGVDPSSKKALAGHASAKVESLAERIAEEAYLVLYMLYAMTKKEASFYLLDRLGRLVPDFSNEPGVLTVAPIIGVKKPMWLRRSAPKLKINYAIPLRLTKTNDGNPAVISDAPYYFESKNELDRLLKDLGAKPMPKDSTFGDIIDAILEKRESPPPDIP